jgi:SAM-dependent methyltransferase
MTPCIVCDAKRVEEFIDLGRTALANKFLKPDELSVPEPTYPLRVGFCHGCGHVQLTEAVPPPAMFEDYLYISSASDTLKGHLFSLSDAVVKWQGLRPDELVIDIGCNDGTLLSGFRRHGVHVLGVDPAKNLAEFAKDSGIERFVGFFNAATANEIAARWGRASAMTATNTFPHIPALQDFVAGIDKVLAPGGVFVIEAHYLVDILEQVAFDTIYHEHVSYWALGPMTELFGRHGFDICHVERLPIHHGQLRVFVRRKGEGRIEASVAQTLENEKKLGLDHIETFRAFAARVRKIKTDLRKTLADLKRDGKRVAGYGAPAKGNTLLSFLELGPDLVEYIADKSPLKQGRYTPGTHIPVVSPTRLLDDHPDYVLLLAWNFVDEILAQQTEYRRRGGRFILPVPEVKIVA